MYFRYVSHIAAAGVVVLCAGVMAGQPSPRPDESQRFTNIARIPAGAETNTIRFEKVRRVEVGTATVKSVYEVTFSYMGQPLVSDEHGDRHFTFKVYFRPEELTPELRDALASG